MHKPRVAQTEVMNMLAGIGVTTPRDSAVHAILDTGHLSDANLSPRAEDSEAYKASSGPGSKHSSFSSHEASLAHQSLGSNANKTVRLMLHP